MSLSLLAFVFSVLALAAETKTSPSAGDAKQASVMSFKTQSEALSYSNPGAKLSGDLRPSGKNHLAIVELTVGATKLEGDIRALKLVTVSGPELSPVAVGGSLSQAVPLDKLQVGQHVGMLQMASGTMVDFHKTNDGVLVSAEAGALLALVYDVPAEVSAKQLKLPDGSLVALRK